MLERIGRSKRQAILLMAELLELRAEEVLSPAEMTPAQRKNATLEILEAFLVAQLDSATVLLLLEDAHWSDPTTQTLIQRLLSRDRERSCADRRDASPRNDIRLGGSSTGDIVALQTAWARALRGAGAPPREPLGN
jgi:predicted ATPase